MIHHRVYPTETFYWPQGRKPGIAPTPETRSFTCECGAKVTTQSRIKFRCDPCQQKADERAQARGAEKLKKKRALRRAGLL